MNCIGYVRVSTRGQMDEGVSLAAQEAKIRDWARGNGADGIQIFNEGGISGKKIKNRPALTAALNAAGKGDALVCYSLSRTARSTRDALDIGEALQRKGADLVSLTEQIETRTAAGKMVFRLMAVLAEFERDQISERTKFGLRYKKSRGEKLGGAHPPFGYRVKAGMLIPISHEQETISRIHGWRNGGASLQEISDRLEDQGIRRKCGGRAWYPVAVSRVLERVA